MDQFVVIRISLESVRDKFECGLGPVWDKFGISSGSVLGSVWCKFGICLGSVWCQFGAGLVSICRVPALPPSSPELDDWMIGFLGKLLACRAAGACDSGVAGPGERIIAIL